MFKTHEGLIRPRIKGVVRALIEGRERPFEGIIRLLTAL